ncbi:hypothetical protein F0Z19_2149 [Vibrio cyclitrophicus]|nr:hypothetical protein F0Z19_2149 [Vibrio cyclitrophicus]
MITDIWQSASFQTDALSYNAKFTFERPDFSSPRNSVSQLV